METFSPQDRVTLSRTHVEDRRKAFAEDVRRGLTSGAKSIPCRYFYDEEGSRLFEEICELPEYYLTRAEREILRTRSRELVSRLPRGVTLVELGSGSSVKTRILIEALLRERDRLVYVPIDISRSAVEESSADLIETYDDLEIEGIIGDYETGLRHLNGEMRSDGTPTPDELRDAPQLVLFLGSSIGNSERDEAAAFLRSVRETLTPRDRLLVGIDLRKDAGVLERAYDDARGVTARFNKNVLARINRELGGRFDLDAFRHRAVYDTVEGRVEIFLVSRRPQRVAIDALELEVSFEEGETIHTENSYKYSTGEIDLLATASGLDLDAQWFDAERRFSLNLFAPDG